MSVVTKHELVLAIVGVFMYTFATRGLPKDPEAYRQQQQRASVEQTPNPDSAGSEQPATSPASEAGYHE